MINFEDDATPLLNTFKRDSSLRTPLRRKGGADLYHLRTNVHARPPLPPRPGEFSLRLRTQSVTEVEENSRALGAFHQYYGAAQRLDSKGWAAEHRVSHLPVRDTPLPYSTTSTTQWDDQSHTNGSSESNYQRNGYSSASLPNRRTTYQKFFTKLSSPLAMRRAKTREADVSISDQDVAHREMPATSYRKPQIPPRPVLSPSPSTGKGTPTNEQPQCNFTRHDRVRERKNSHIPQQTGNAFAFVERSTSCRQQRSPHWPDVLWPVTTPQAERLCNNTLKSPSERPSGGWGTESQRVSHRDLGSDRQLMLRGIRRHSSLPRPVPAYRGSPVEPRTHSRHPSPMRRGETSPPIITSPITPNTSTNSSPINPRSFTRSQSWNLEVRSPGQLSRITTSREINAGRGNTKDANGDSCCNSPLGSRISSDSGYSSCSSPSRRSSTISEGGEDDMIEWFGSRLNLEDETLPAGPPKDHFSYLMEKEREYLQCLKSMMSDYQAMSSKTPSLIRQRFDLIFQQLNIIYQFQLDFQKALQETRGDPQQLAGVFCNEQFQHYGRFMAMTPAAQEDLLQYASHIKEHFPDLRRNILKPSLRINFYAMILSSFKKEASEEAKVKLQAAIAYLNQVKQKANTEMTLSTVVHSPVDLRLGGDMLHIGEFTCIGGGSLQKKKYQLILFENLFVITSKKLPFFKYKTHYRVEQLESVTEVGVNELHLNVLSEGQKQLVTLKFTTKSQKSRDEWISVLQRITKHNTRLSRGRNSITIRSPRRQYRMLPLDLRRVFPLVRAVLDAELEGAESTAEWTLQKIKYHEGKYIEQLSVTLNPEYTRPPGELSDLLENLYKVHTKQFLPALNRSQTESDFLDYLVENLDKLTVYVDYLVVRSQLTVELDEVPQAGEYILPVQHLYGVYFGLMKELCRTDRCRSSALRIIKRLQEHVETAQLRVQEGAILNGRVDFQRSGKLILHTPLEVKTRKKEIRAGDYIGLLFENVIIFTRSKQPYYEYVMDIWLDQANLGPPASHDCTFRLEVRQGRRKEPITYELSANSPEMKKLWQKLVHEQLLAQVHKIRQRWVSDV